MICKGFGVCSEYEIEKYYEDAKSEVTIENIIEQLKEKLSFCEKESECLQDLASTFRNLIKSLEEKKPTEDQGG